MATGEPHPAQAEPCCPPRPGPVPSQDYEHTVSWAVAATHSCVAVSLVLAVPPGTVLRRPRERAARRACCTSRSATSSSLYRPSPSLSCHCSTAFRLRDRAHHGGVRRVGRPCQHRRQAARQEEHLSPTCIACRPAPCGRLDFAAGFWRGAVRRGVCLWGRWPTLAPDAFHHGIVAQRAVRRTPDHDPGPLHCRLTVTEWEDGVRPACTTPRSTAVHESYTPYGNVTGQSYPPTSRCPC